jgi:hypothetical protein
MTAWIDHVRSKAKEYGLSYKAAMSDARVKSSYTKAPRPKATKPQTSSEPPKTAKERRTMAASRAMELIHKRNADGSQSWHDAVSQVIQESADAGSRFMKEKKPRKPMSEETKAMLKERRATKKASEAPPPRTTTLKERRQNAAKRAMELTQNKPSDTKERKPMSEETKAMLKARRAAKKDDIAKKFEAFWERHGTAPTATPLQEVVDTVVDAVVEEAPSSWSNPRKGRQKGVRRPPTDEQRARWKENARIRLATPRTASLFGEKYVADAEKARQYRNDPKMRKRLTELNKERKKKGDRRIDMHVAVLSKLL